MRVGTITDNLNVRRIGASLSSKKNGFFTNGKQVIIKKTVFGEEINGNDIWYVLNSGEFIWSGCVDTNQPIEPPKTKKIIFTADDYGVVDSIDEGIIKAIKKGILNSVACLSNYGKEGQGSLKNVRKLQQAIKESGRTVELGIHFTITSGAPIKRGVYKKICHQYINPHAPREYGFYKVGKIIRRYRKMSTESKRIFCAEMKEELKAQMNVFLMAKDENNNPDPIAISHLTSHHNVFLFHSDFFQIMLDVIKGDWIPNSIKEQLPEMQFPIPIRSLTIFPDFKSCIFMFVKGRIKNNPLRQIRALEKIICSENTTENNKVITPGFLNVNHYGPPPILIKGTITKLVIKKKRILKSMLYQLQWGNYDSMEFLLHLRINNGKYRHRYFEQEMEKIGYSGIDAKAFDSRAAELSSFIGALKTTSYLPKGIELGTWKELSPQQSCIYRRNSIDKIGTLELDDTSLAHRNIV